MSTEEIIRRLGEIKAVYPEALGNAVGEAESNADLKALTAAIQAVERLEEIKRGNKNDCNFCKHYAVKTTCFPCCACTIVNGHWGGTNQWEFRWPLGEDTTT